MGINPAVLYKILWGGLPFSKDRKSEQSNQKEKTKKTEEDLSRGEIAGIQSPRDWIRQRDKLLGRPENKEGMKSKTMRIVKQNPLVPIGTSVSVGALAYGIWCYQKGRAGNEQMMMRARIVAQGFVVVGMLASVIIAGTKEAERRLREMELKEDPPRV